MQTLSKTAFAVATLVPFVLTGCTHEQTSGNNIMEFVVPTILELTGIPFPETIDGFKQKPLAGVSLADSFDDARAPTRLRTQYFEMMGNRGVYHDGWMDPTTPLRLPWQTYGSSPNPDDFEWELYDVAEDFSQSNDLAAREPAKLNELQKVFDEEAKKYEVHPLDSSFAERVDPSIRPSLTRGLYPAPAVAEKDRRSSGHARVAP